MTAPVVSEARVPVAPYQQVPGTDLTAMGTLGQGSLDNVVENILLTGVGYAGMGVAQVGTSAILTVQPGFLVKSGPGYSLRDAFSVDVSAAINSVPDSAKTAIVCIVADGQEFPTTETRTFVDASKLPTDPTQPAPTVTQATPTRVVRSIVISSPKGTPDVQPTAPSFSSALCLLATIVVSNTAIVSVTQSTTQQITRLDQIAPIVAGLSTSVASMQSLFSGLLSSVASLSSSIANLRAQLQAAIADLQAQLNALATRTTTPAGAIFRGADYFVDLSESNPAASAYNALIAGGLRFATSSHQDLSLTLQAPYSGNVQVLGSKFTLPYAENPTPYTLTNAADAGATVLVSFANIAPYSAQCFIRAMARARTRASKTLVAAASAQLLANGDPSQIFAIDPTTFVYDPTWGDWRANNPQLSHYPGYWQDFASREYWTPVDSITAINGQPVIAQPMIAPSSFMATSAEYLFGPNSQSGTLRFLLMGDVNGKPDPTHTYVDMTLNYAGGTIGNSVPKFTFPYPVLQIGGRKYHYVLLSSNGLQNIYSGPGQTLNIYSGPGQTLNSGSPTTTNFGDALAIVNGDWGSIQSGSQIALRIYAAQFTGAVSRVSMAPLQLSGGADTIDIAVKLILPEGCTLGYEVYIGGQWVSIDQLETGSADLLGGGPSNLPINMVLSGTALLAPIVDLTTGASTSRFSKNGVALDHVSSVQTPSAPVTTIHKSTVIDGWNPSVQTLTANLRTGTGYATLTSPTSTPVDTIQADGSLLRQFTWVLGSAVSTFEMELIGTTSNATQTFVARQTSWDASP